MMSRKEFIQYIEKNIDIHGEYKNYKSGVIYSISSRDYEKVINYIEDRKKKHRLETSYTTLSAWIVKNCKDEKYYQVLKVAKNVKSSRDEGNLKVENLIKNTKNCLYCYAILKKKYKESNFSFNKRKFCNVSCISSAYHSSQRVLKIQEKKCMRCGNKLIIKKGETPFQFNKRKFCNVSCSVSHRHSHRVINTKNCKNCGSQLIMKSYDTSHSLNKRKFCSEECSHISKRFILMEGRKCQESSCNKILTIKENEMTRQFNKRKFCDRKCYGKSMKK